MRAYHLRHRLRSLHHQSLVRPGHRALSSSPTVSLTNQCITFPSSLWAFFFLLGLLVLIVGIAVFGPIHSEILKLYLFLRQAGPVGLLLVLLEQQNLVARSTIPLLALLGHDFLKQIHLEGE